MKAPMARSLSATLVDILTRTRAQAEVMQADPVATNRALSCSSAQRWMPTAVRPPTW